MTYVSIEGQRCEEGDDNLYDEREFHLDGREHRGRYNKRVDAVCLTKKGHLDEWNKLDVEERLESE